MCGRRGCLPRYVRSILGRAFGSFRLVLVSSNSASSDKVLYSRCTRRRPHLVAIVRRGGRNPLFTQQTNVKGTGNMCCLFLSTSSDFYDATVRALCGYVETRSIRVIVFGTSFRSSFRAGSGGCPFPDSDMLRKRGGESFLGTFYKARVFGDVYLGYIRGSVVSSRSYSGTVRIECNRSLFRSVPLISHTESVYIVRIPLCCCHRRTRDTARYCGPTRFRSLGVMYRELVMCDRG